VFYRILRFVNKWYAIVVLWIFLAAFVLGVSFMFVFPQITLGLFFLGLATLGVAVVASGFLQSVQRMLARRRLSAGICPRCGSRIQLITHAEATVQCPDCRSMFTVTGMEIEKRPDMPVHDASDDDRIV
jgi:hypothetical protein